MRTELDKLKKICGYCRVLMLFLTAVFALVTVALVILTIVSAVSPETVEPLIEIHSEDSIPAALAISSIVLLFVTATLWMLTKIIGDISREYTPFTKVNAERFRLLSILYVVFAVIAVAVSASGIVTDALAFAFASMLAALIFYCMHLTYSYATMLQRESDETL